MRYEVLIQLHVLPPRCLLRRGLVLIGDEMHDL